MGVWQHLRVWILCNDPICRLARTLDGFHGCGVEDFLHPGSLCIGCILEGLLFFVFQGMVQDVDAQQKAVVHDLEAF